MRDLGRDRLEILLPYFLDVGAVDTVARGRLSLFLGVHALLVGDQPFAVGDRDLEVVRMDFRKG